MTTTWTPAPATRGPGEPMFTHDDGFRTSLNEILGLDTYPIEVHADGTLTSREDVHSPGADGVYATVDTEGSYVPTAQADAAGDLARYGWEPMRGYSGQYGAGSASWFMHASEFVGGRLAADILAEPGVYAAVMILPDAPDDEHPEPTEWAVIRRTA